MDARTPAQLLAEIMTVAGLNQTSVADRLKVSQPTIHRILNGSSDFKASTLIAIQTWHAEVTQQAAA
jgi:transcriptional regulator with XRE-family HTH domain